MKRILLIAIPVLALLALVGWRIETKTGATKKLNDQSRAAKNAPITVATAVAGPQKIASQLSTVGTVESPFQVKLSPNVSGRIDYLEVREGDPVHVGQVLVRIDPTYVEGQILQAQANLAEAKQKYTQSKITEDANTVSILMAVQQVKASVASTEADYNESKVTYEHTVGAAHEATVDAEARVAAADSTVQSSEASLALAQANLADAKAKYTRTYSLYSQGFDSAQDLDDQAASEKVNQAMVNSAMKIVDANKSALNSAQAQYRAAHHQEQVAEKLGLSTIQDNKAKWVEAKQMENTALANKAQIPAYVQNLKALQSEVDAAQAALDQANAQKQFLIVKSSIEGTVTQRLFDPGAQATPGSPILVVQANSPLFLTTAAPVEDARYVKHGMDMRIRIDALPGQTFHAKVTDINLAADPSSRQFMVRSVLDNSSGELRPGMYARVHLTTTYASAPIAVPIEAVKTDTSNTSTVTTVDDKGIAHVVPVVTGIQDSNFVQIASGINAGDKVIVLTYRTVTDKAKVVEGTWAVVKAGGGRPIGKGGPNTAASTDLSGSAAGGSSGGRSGPSSAGATTGAEGGGNAAGASPLSIPPSGANSSEGTATTGTATGTTGSATTGTTTGTATAGAAAGSTTGAGATGTGTTAGTGGGH